MHGSVADGHRLARVSPPDQQLSPLRLIRTVIRNPIETWPKPVYEQPLYRSRFMGREIVFVMEPDLIRQVLVTRLTHSSKPSPCAAHSSRCSGTPF
jgi:hypothetical protein